MAKDSKDAEAQKKLDRLLDDWKRDVDEGLDDGWQRRD